MAGARIVAMPRTSRGVYSAVSDADGRFRIELPAGSYRGVADYWNVRIPLGDFAVAPHEVVQLDAGISHVLVAADKDQDQRPHCPDATGQHIATPRETDELVAAVLEHFVEGDATFVHAEHFFDRDVVYIESEIGVHCSPDLQCSNDAHVTAGALPRGSSSEFVVKTRNELQAMADLERTSVEYLRFTQINVADDCAAVGVGVSIMMPADEVSIRRRCTSTQLFEKRAGQWRFAAPTTGYCD